MTLQERYRLLGHSGIRVSRLGGGTNRWAQGKNDQAVFAAFQVLIRGGINFFDTAEVYNHGRSERLLGSCLARESQTVVVASKFMPYPALFLRHRFLNALDNSLSRLGLKTLDLYYVHFPTPWFSPERLMDVMAEAVEAGKIRAVGVSNFNAGQMRRAATRLARYRIPLAANQVHYNLLHREPEINGVLETCKELNVALVAYRPLGRGRLISDFRSTVTAGSSSPGGNMAVARKDRILMSVLQRIAAEHEKSVSQVALNWLLQRDEHVIPIPGASTARHALENLGALSWEMSEEEFAAIDDASAP